MTRIGPKGHVGGFQKFKKPTRLFRKHDSQNIGVVEGGTELRGNGGDCSARDADDMLKPRLPD